MTNPYRPPASVDDEEPVVDPRILDPAIIDLPPKLEFALGSLQAAQFQLKQCHVNGRDVCRAALQIAHDLNGDEALLMLNDLGISRSEDLGDAVYKLIEMQVIRANQDDSVDDFSGLFDTSTPSESWEVRWSEDR